MRLNSQKNRRLRPVYEQQAGVLIWRSWMWESILPFQSTLLDRKELEKINRNEDL